MDAATWSFNEQQLRLRCFGRWLGKRLRFWHNDRRPRRRQRWRTGRVCESVQFHRWWSRQIGALADDSSYSVSADSLGNVFTSGRTYGSLGGPNAGGSDAFVSKYDSSGVLQWIRQLGTADADVSYGVSADGLGSVYISGETDSSLGGPLSGSADAFLGKFDSAGNLLWLQQVGSSGADDSQGVSADGLGHVYVTGLTNGDFGGTNAGIYDAYVAKFSEPIVPEPSSLALIGLVFLAYIGRDFSRPRRR